MTEFMLSAATAAHQVEGNNVKSLEGDPDCGGIGVFSIHEMGRFYRHVLIQKHYPHHGAVAFGHFGKAFFEVFKFLGVEDIAYNQPKSLPYPTENPWA